MAILYTVLEDHESASRHVAGLLVETINRHSPDTSGLCTLGLATGSTPLSVYENLCRRYQSGEVSFQGITTFNLDEYVGLPPEHPQSYLAYMRTNLFDHVDLDRSKTHLPAAHQIDDSHSAEAISRRYESEIENAGGIDWQLLGIGVNGHIGFNEPGATIDSPTRLVDLAASTIEANSRFFESTDQVPKQAITMGIGTILKARKIVLLATGAAKAEAVAAAINGPVTSDNPASFLQTHSDVLFVLDREAASAIA
ncbi:glucosamine-6-phosphate deaminase [Neorhodopirellula pilleata]|uniref:Glucosamine-6-phosphate deaminase n=1 Tax=Neorhodopirellula pilleata TaxID=2714738 RepID=A0A5C6AP52_9BACT|nr:glucosamine-6-phosphate deaminase [Neorhodopirellula pilleata]TWU01460.1 Glucosamine-6-phosphate deaminase 1 [Neorhodopirellula pilleata]